MLCMESHLMASKNLLLNIHMAAIWLIAMAVNIMAATKMSASTVVIHQGLIAIVCLITAINICSKRMKFIPNRKVPCQLMIFGAAISSIYRAYQAPVSCLGPERERHKSILIGCIIRGRE